MPARAPARRGPIPSSLLTNQTGTLGERTVASLLMLLSDGDLHIARPRVDDHAVDLIAYRDGVPLALSLQPKVDSGPSARGALQFSFKLAALPADLDSYFGLCLYFPENRVNLDDPFWWIPGSQVLGARKRRGDRVVQTYLEGGASHKWDAFRHPLRDIARLVGAELDRLAAARGLGEVQPSP